MSLVVQQHVVQLQVPVDDPPLVEEVQRERYLGRVEARVFFWQTSLTLHVEPMLGNIVFFVIFLMGRFGTFSMNLVLYALLRSHLEVINFFDQ